MLVENGNGVSGLGLFGATQDANISDLVVENPVIRQGIFYIASLIGIMNNGRVDRVQVTKTSNTEWDTEGVAQLGGLVGELRFGTIADSSSQVNVRATGALDLESIGGLVGKSDRATITRSHASGKVGDGNGIFIGGLVGRALNTSITRSYATGAVHGVSRVGGLVGSSVYVPPEGGAEDIPMLLENVYSDGNVRGGQYTGALIGEFGTSWVGDPFAGGTLRFAHSTGNVTLDGDPGVVAPIPVGLIGNVLVANDENNITKVYYSGTAPAEPVSAFLGDPIGVKLEGDNVNNLAQYEGFDNNTWHTQSPPQLIPTPAPSFTENNQELGVIEAPQEEVEEGEANNGMNDQQDAQPGGSNDENVLLGEGEGEGEQQAGGEGEQPGGEEEGADDASEDAADNTPSVDQGDENQGEALTTHVTVDELKELAELEEDYELEERDQDPDAPHIVRATFKNKSGEKVTIKYNTQTGAREVRIIGLDGREEIYLYTPDGQKLPLKQYISPDIIEEYTYDENYQPLTKKVTDKDGSLDYVYHANKWYTKNEWESFTKQLLPGPVLVIPDGDAAAASHFAPLADVTVKTLSGNDIVLGLEAIAKMPHDEQKAKIEAILKGIDTEYAFKKLSQTVESFIKTLSQNPYDATTPIRVQALSDVTSLILENLMNSDGMAHLLQKVINDPQIIASLKSLWGQFGENLISQSSPEANARIVGVLRGLAGQE